MAEILAERQMATRGGDGLAGMHMQHTLPHKTTTATGEVAAVLL